MRNFLWIILNLLAVFLAGIIHYNAIAPSLENILFSESTVRLVYVLFFLATAFLYLTSKRIQKFGIGFIPLIAISTIGILIFLNKKVVLKEEFIPFQMESYVPSNTQKIRIKVLRHEEFFNLNTTGFRIIPVDSIEILGKKGLLGFFELTDSIRIPENEFCQDKFSAEDSGVGHYNLARDLSFRRCFKNSLFHFNKHLVTEPKDKEALYERAMVHMFLKNYEVAIRDFSTILQQIEEEGRDLKKLENIVHLIQVQNILARVEYCKIQLNNNDVR